MTEHGQNKPSVLTRIFHPYTAEASAFSSRRDPANGIHLLYNLFQIHPSEASIHCLPSFREADRNEISWKPSEGWNSSCTDTEHGARCEIAAEGFRSWNSVICLPLGYSCLCCAKHRRKFYTYIYIYKLKYPSDWYLKDPCMCQVFQESHEIKGRRKIKVEY